jgi:hypothetical protein
MIKDGVIVTYRPSISTLCNETSGMSLSVVSVLARANVDPWEEASRLARMPKALAERALVAILDLVPGRNWKPVEAKSIAARLVRLLPQPGEGGPTEVSPGNTKQKNYWCLWVVFAIGISVLAPRHPAATVDAGIATSQPGMPAAKSLGESAVSPRAGDRLP